MRKQLAVAVTVGVLTLLTSSAAFAQAPVTTVTVPFEFIVGDAVLPPGSYVVTNILEGPGMLSIRSEDGKSSAVVLVNLADRPSSATSPTFAFAKVAGRCFLSTVNTPGRRTQVIPLPRGRVEAVLARLNGVEAPRGGRPTLR